jgi:hypothetical protein
MGGKTRKKADRRGVRPGWTGWIHLASDGEVFDALSADLPSYPGCYELAISTEGGQPRPVYVGRATEREKGIRIRVHHHATAVSGDRRFCDKVTAVGRKRYDMFVSYRVTTRAGAKKLEARCLEKWWRYHWNTIGMPWGRA